MSGEDPMEGAGWGKRPSREGFSERDPALARRGRREEARLPLGALLIAVIGMAAGTVGSVTTSGNARFDLTVEEGVARAGFAIAILAGLWISFGGRDRAPGARLVGMAVVVITLLLTIATA